MDLLNGSSREKSLQELGEKPAQAPFPHFEVGLKGFFTVRRVFTLPKPERLRLDRRKETRLEFS